MNKFSYIVFLVSFVLVLCGCNSEKQLTIDENVTEITMETPIASQEGIISMLESYYDENKYFHINCDKWLISSDYNLFRNVFFGLWENENKSFIISDAETSFIDGERRFYCYFNDFYAVEDNILAFTISGSAGGELYWIEIDNPNLMYSVEGAPGDYPNAILCDDNNKPIVKIYNKINSEIQTPKDNNYLSILCIREIAEKYNIDLSMLVNFEIKTENGVARHDDSYYFFPVYLESESDTELVLKTTVGDLYSPDNNIEVLYSIKNISGSWTRSILTN